MAWDKKTNLRPGELGVLQSHRDILKAAWFEGLQRVLILEDDAIPHCRLQEKLLEALEDDACGALTLGRGPQEVCGPNNTSTRGTCWERSPNWGLHPSHEAGRKRWGPSASLFSQGGAYTSLHALRLPCA